MNEVDGTKVGPLNLTAETEEMEKYFLLEPDSTRGGSGHGVVFENVKRLVDSPRLVLRPHEGGIPKFKEVPRLVYSPAKGEPPEDLEGGMSGYWLVSKRLKDVFEKTDPAGFEFAECDYRLADGSSGPTYFLCDVVRVLDAVDEEASELKIETSDKYHAGKHYSFSGGARLSFLDEVVGSAHVFRTPYSGNYIVCDRVLRDAIVDAGIWSAARSNGVWFIDAADI